jgi:hypothetical protein
MRVSDWHWNSSPWAVTALAAVVSFGLYINTLGNSYVFDDRPLYTENDYVQQGWRGIPRIFSSDMFASKYEKYALADNLPGGRYRPMVLMTFALEVALVGQVGWISHGLNVCLYAACILVAGRMTHRLFPGRSVILVVTLFLFALHPVHTEVVNNVKSRDELLSFLFIGLTCLGHRSGLCPGAVQQGICADSASSPSALALAAGPAQRRGSG